MANVMGDRLINAERHPKSPAFYQWKDCGLWKSRGPDMGALTQARILLARLGDARKLQGNNGRKSGQTEKASGRFIRSPLDSTARMNTQSRL